MELNNKQIEELYKYSRSAYYANLFRVRHFYDIQEDDIVQEAVLKAWRGIDNFKGECKLSSWVYQITKFTIYNRIAESKKKFTNPYLKRFFLEDMTDGIEEWCKENDIYPEVLYALLTDSLEDQVYHADMEEISYERLEALPKEMKDVTNLLLEGKMYHEIAEELGIPIGTVRSRIFRAKRKLELPECKL